MVVSNTQRSGQRRQRQCGGVPSERDVLVPVVIGSTIRKKKDTMNYIDHDDTILSKVMGGTGIGGSGTTTTTGLVVNDPLGLCLVAEGTLVAPPPTSSSAVSLSTTTNPHLERHRQPYYGTYTNIVQLAQQLSFQVPSITATTTTQPPDTTTTPTTTTTPISHHQHSNRVVVVTIETDETTIFVTPYHATTDSSHPKNHEYTVALQLPNTIPVVPNMTTATTSALDDDKNNNMATDEMNPSLVVPPTHDTTTTTGMVSEQDATAPEDIKANEKEEMDESIRHTIESDRATTIPPSSTITTTMHAPNTTTTTMATPSSLSNLENMS